MICENCEGTGRVVREPFKQDGITHPAEVISCFNCNGTGEFCDHCGEAIDYCGGNCQDEDE